jgi:conjugal transfer pilus assembly protein TraB
VIDQKVKGFIVDQDGKIGLRGKVVAKMGSMIARAALAGFASGVGDAV